MIGLVTLTNAVTADTVVTFGTSNASVANPDLTVTIPKGQNSAYFTIDTFTVKAKTNVTISATIGVKKLTTVLEVDP